MNRLCVARYREPLEWLGTVPADWTARVYNKGPDDLVLPDGVEAVACENVGREAETWCRAIEESLHDATMGALACVQGDVEKHLREGFRMPSSVDDPVWRTRRFQPLADHLSGFAGGYVPIGPRLWCGPDGRPDHFGLGMDAAYRYVFDRRAPERILFNAWAQFIVSRDMLMRVRWRELERLRIVITEWNLGPWLAERLWPTLFGVRWEEETL